jgi:hypothetical protein
MNVGLPTVSKYENNKVLFFFTSNGKSISISYAPSGKEI